MKTEIRICGSGGQGVILATIILAEAAVAAGKHAAQSQSYGPEARGGMCKADVIISDGEIWFTKVERPTYLMALTQQALDRYSRELPESCTLIADSGLNVPEGIAPETVLTLPILRTAREEVGSAMTANMVAVGVMNRLLRLVTHEELIKAVTAHIPRGTEELNTRALAAGEALAG